VYCRLAEIVVVFVVLVFEDVSSGMLHGGSNLHERSCRGLWCLIRNNCQSSVIAVCIIVVIALQC
jgi:hypothetical protein